MDFPTAASVSPAPGPPGAGWYPAAIEGDEVVWQFLGGAGLTEPFFHDTLRKHRHLPQRRTPLGSLRDVSATGAAAPAAFIFHASRCGSTLVMQMLACLPGCRCLSEPPALDTLLAKLLAAQQGDDGLLLLRGLIRSFGQPQHGVRHLFIKHDSWHLAALPLMQQAFPGVPCWFLCRDPAAILRSHQKERGSQMVPGLVNLAPFGMEFPDIPPWDLDGRTVAVLTAILRTASTHVRTGTLRPWDGTSLPGSLDETWLASHAVYPDSASLARMQQRAHYHSKHPSQPWQSSAGGDSTGPAVEELRRLWQSLTS